MGSGGFAASNLGWGVEMGPGAQAEHIGVVGDGSGPGFQGEHIGVGDASGPGFQGQMQVGPGAQREHIGSGPRAQGERMCCSSSPALAKKGSGPCFFRALVVLLPSFSDFPSFYGGGSIHPSLDSLIN